MKTSIVYSIVVFLCCLLYANLLLGQNTYEPKQTGFINFNLGRSTFKHKTQQSLSLIGCNTNITLDSKLWKGSKKGLVWGKENQIVPGIPSGAQVDSITGETFYVSKYYMASPPVVSQHKSFANDPSAVFDIGIVTPHRFTFEGDKPVQDVYMKYNILKPVHIEFFEVNYDASFDELGVDFIPFNVQCNDFPWLDTKSIKKAKGASGIGSVTKSKSSKSGFFLPYYYKTPKDTTTKTFLDCEVTLLNDVLYHYEVFFMIDGIKLDSPTLNLKEYYELFGNIPITLCCEYREELPCGCQPNEVQNPYRN